MGVQTNSPDDSHLIECCVEESIQKLSGNQPWFNAQSYSFFSKTADTNV
jgi:hypothetical protein